MDPGDPSTYRRAILKVEGRGGCGPTGSMASSLKKVIFVSYGTFDCNSAGHIWGFARRLGELGHAVAVAARDGILDAYAFGEPSFAFFTNQDLAEDPRGVIGFDGSLEPERTMMVCWTPRKAVRRTVSKALRQVKVPYVVHFEDNEDHLTRLRLGMDAGEPDREQLEAAAADAAERASLLAGAAGATIIEPRLAEVLPAGLPTLLLEPGVESTALGSPLPPHRRSSLLRALGAPPSAAVIVYPGNIHRANAAEMAELYAAIGLLRARGRDVVLVKTGKDDPQAASRVGPARSEHGVFSLGHVDRRVLTDLLKCADLFVQPGAPGPFNDFRLPSKLPEFMAVGRPIVLPRTNVGLRLRHGEDAMLLETGSTDEIATAVETILADPGLAARLSANARAFAARTYDWDRQGDTLADFLERLRQAAPR
jgi:glycosyltransferase involved in cell wall biosynthesis